MTKYEICQLLADVAGLPLEHMVANSENDPNAAVQRPYDCHLSTKALRDIGISVDTVPFKDWWYVFVLYVTTSYLSTLPSYEAYDFKTSYYWVSPPCPLPIPFFAPFLPCPVFPRFPTP